MAKIPDDIAQLLDWIPMKRYQELYGETYSAVQNRMSKKIWAYGVHYSKPPGGGLWVSMSAVNAWAGHKSHAEDV